MPRYCTNYDFDVCNSLCNGYSSVSRGLTPLPVRWKIPQWKSHLHGQSRAMLWIINPSPLCVEGHEQYLSLQDALVLVLLFFCPLVILEIRLPSTSS